MTILELSQAMASVHPPEWEGASWIGSLDLQDFADCDAVRLNGSEGYSHARVLVRDGARLRGFIYLEVHNGVVDGAHVEKALAGLPSPAPEATASTLPAITVVVCTRDRASLLREALTAIVALDYPQFDVLIVDNASRTSETRDLVRDEFSGLNVSLLEERTPGLSYARNSGLKHATGEIVAFTDDDVVVDPLWLRQLAAGFARDHNVDCVTGLVPSGELRTRSQSFFDDRVSWSRNLSARVYTMSDPPADLPMFPFSIGQFGTGANFALRRNAALDLGGFDVALGVGTRTGGGEDIDMFTRVILHGSALAVEPSAFVWHRHRDDLEALRVQARGYGTGLGAWLTKLLLNPRTALMAATRSPHAISRLVSLAWRKPEEHDGIPSGPRDEWDREVARVGWLELVSVVRGPWCYFRQRTDHRRKLRKRDSQ